MKITAREILPNQRVYLWAVDFLNRPVNRTYPTQAWLAVEQVKRDMGYIRFKTAWGWSRPYCPSDPIEVCSDPSEGQWGEMQSRPKPGETFGGFSIE